MKRVFIGRKEGGAKKLKVGYFSRTPSLRGRQGFVKQITSLVMARKFHTDSFRILLLEEAETAIRFGY